MIIITHHNNMTLKMKRNGRNLHADENQGYISIMGLYGHCTSYLQENTRLGDGDNFYKTQKMQWILLLQLALNCPFF